MRSALTERLIRLLRWLNPSPNDRLARILHDAAIDYEEKPGARCCFDVYIRSVVHRSPSKTE